MMDEGKMVRKQVYLEPSQNDDIKRLSAKQGRTEADIIREAIDEYVVLKRRDMEDPLVSLIGMTDGTPDGAAMHDRDLAAQPAEERG